MRNLVPCPNLSVRQLLPGLRSEIEPLFQLYKHDYVYVVYQWVLLVFRGVYQQVPDKLLPEYSKLGYDYLSAL